MLPHSEIAQKSTKLCYRVRRWHKKVRNCATAFGDGTKKYETVLPHFEIAQKSTKLCYRIWRWYRKVRNCSTAFGDGTEKYETVLPHFEMVQKSTKLCYFLPNAFRLAKKVLKCWQYVDFLFRLVIFLADYLAICPNLSNFAAVISCYLKI